MPESVTYVIGMTCNLCAKKHINKLQQNTEISFLSVCNGLHMAASQ